MCYDCEDHSLFDFTCAVQYMIYFIYNFIRACYVGNTITQERRGHSCDALIIVLVAREISRTVHHPCLQYDVIDSAKLLKEIKMRGQLQ